MRIVPERCPSSCFGTSGKIRPYGPRRPGQDMGGVGMSPSRAFLAMSRVSVSKSDLPAIHSR